MTDFVTLVAEAVGHLYDLPYLQTHRVGRLLVRDPAGDVRGRAVQRALLDGIATLKPIDAAGSPHAWRTYRYLFLRYVQALPPGEVADELAISQRQARRTYREAIDALASVLWDRVGPAGAADTAAPDSTLDDEVRHLAAAARGGTTDLAEVLAGVRATVGPVAASRGCAVEIAPAGPLPRLALDRALVRQIALNVLTHAIELGPGAIRLAAAADADAVRLEVAHRGADATRRLADTSRLDVARRLAEAEGGAVELDPTGPSLVVRLPAARRTSVLVVDDNPDVTAVFRRYLESVGFEVVTTDRGDRAVAIAADLRPAAVTLDVMMAGQDGWETLQQLKNHPDTQAVPVLICSVLREAELARFLGAAELLPKPVTRPALLGALEQLGLLHPQPAGPPPAASRSSA
jgi:CheY-like chemotaxis protein